MVQTREQIKAAALKLDPVELESLAEKQFLSIDDRDCAAIDKAWIVEAHRRDAEYSAGRGAAKPVDQVIDRLFAKGQP